MIYFDNVPSHSRPYVLVLVLLFAFFVSVRKHGYGSICLCIRCISRHILGKLLVNPALFCLSLVSWRGFFASCQLCVGGRFPFVLFRVLIFERCSFSVKRIFPFIMWDVDSISANFVS